MWRVVPYYARLNTNPAHLHLCLTEEINYQIVRLRELKLGLIEVLRTTNLRHDVWITLLQKLISMKNLLLSFILAGLAFSAQAQKYFTKTGHIWFYSHAPLEDIEAHNYQVTSIIDSKTGDLVYKVTMTGFQFENALMQEHFNEKYVESEKFPESIFKGKITNPGEVDFTKDGSYQTTVEGELTIHGITKPVKAEGTITVKEGKIQAKSLFQIAVADYEIKIPSAVKDNIAKVIDINVDIGYEPMKQ